MAESSVNMAGERKKNTLEREVSAALEEQRISTRILKADLERMLSVIEDPNERARVTRLIDQCNQLLTIDPDLG